VVETHVDTQRTVITVSKHEWAEEERCSTTRMERGVDVGDEEQGCKKRLVAREERNLATRRVGGVSQESFLARKRTVRAMQGEHNHGTQTT